MRPALEILCTVVLGVVLGSLLVVHLATSRTAAAYVGELIDLLRAHL
jgi:ABC-type nitrate/sulfonate/bicarbonate transport system permease component